MYANIYTMYICMYAKSVLEFVFYVLYVCMYVCTGNYTIIMLSTILHAVRTCFLLSLQ